MKKGIILFAENNDQINYIDIAIANAYMIKEHMNVDVCLVTDSNIEHKIFNKVIKVYKSKKQIKQFIGYGKYEKLGYYNSNRTLAYDLSPFEETILLDVDYLILDDTLNLCWGCQEEILINNIAKDLYNNYLNIRERRLFDTNIPLSWATVVYFKKSERAELFFKLIKHIQKNYVYYAGMFNIPVGFYRNDYAFSIANHLMSDCYNSNINSLPDKIILTSLPADKIMQVRKGIIDLVAKVNEWHYPVQVTQNFHYMNKFDLSEQANNIIEVYNG